MQSEPTTEELELLVARAHARTDLMNRLLCATGQMDDATIEKLIKYAERLNNSFG